MLMTNRSFFWAALVLLCIPFASSADTPASIKFGEIEVVIDSKVYALEHAQTMQQRARGLMFRESLCDNCGMLFTFSVPRVGSIWMKNTYIPLDLAYIDEDGVITSIHQLKPHDLTSVSSETIVAYALEMNQGWFAAKGVKVGDHIIINSK